MGALIANPGPTGPLSWFRGDDGLPGRIALSWSLAGGLSMEAVLVAARVLSGSPEAAADPLTVTLFFLMGAVGGFVHGALVGVAGRTLDVTLPAALRGIEAAAVTAVLLGVGAWGAALWISLTPTAVAGGRPGFVAATGIGWLVFLGLGAWAAVEGLAGLRGAMVRWPERRPGMAVVLTVFVTLLALFVWRRPEIWFTDLRVSALGAAFLALGVTVWIALPVVIFLLHLLRRWRSGRSIWEGDESG